jgi:hypothetical protein
MGWPPEAGETLPRAAQAWAPAEKWAVWVLAPGGHGPDWRRVFRIGPEDWELLWEALLAGVQDAPITDVRIGKHGIGCEVALELTIGERSAGVVSAWHYAEEEGAPRLVTAYPKPYNRGRGSGA